MIAPRRRRQEVVAAFDRLAPTYTSRYEGESSLGHSFRTHQRRVCEAFDKPGGRVLDIGCGSGVMADWLLDQGCEVHGIDISEGMIDVCKWRFKDVGRARFSIGTVETLSFRDHFFDAVVCKGVLDYVDNEAMAVAEIARVLKPGGTAVVTLQQFFSPWRWWTQHIASLRNPPPNVIGRSYKAGCFSKLLDSQGLLTQHVVFCNFQLFLKPLDRLFPRPAVWVAESLERFYRCKWCCWIATGIVVKATRL